MSKNLLQVRLNDELEMKKQALIEQEINISDKVRSFLLSLYDEICASHTTPIVYDNLA